MALGTVAASDRQKSATVYFAQLRPFPGTNHSGYHSNTTKWHSLRIALCLYCDRVFAGMGGPEHYQYASWILHYSRRLPCFLCMAIFECEPSLPVANNCYCFVRSGLPPSVFLYQQSGYVTCANNPDPDFWSGHDPLQPDDGLFYRYAASCDAGSGDGKSWGNVSAG